VLLGVISPLGDGMPYRRRYYWRRRRQTSPQEKADQTSRELYWQVRREISNESQELRLRFSDHLICGMTSAIASAAVVALLFWYLFSFVFPIHPLRVSHYYEMGHAVFVLAVLVSAVYFLGNILNYYLWPKILKIAGFIVVTVAFYFALKGRANHLYIVPYFLCCWIWVLVHFELSHLQNKRITFEDKKLLERGLDPKERDRLIGPPG
jgi:hypothetical protein